MGRSQYARAAKMERELKKKFELDGCYVMRSAGSKGPFDLAVFEPDRVRLIQVKSVGEQVDEERLRDVDVPECCTKEIWFKIPYRGFHGAELK